MKRNKITLAVLIVLFVCQFAFASTFQSADKAGTAAVWQHAAACDALENLKVYEKDVFAFFKGVATASDETIDGYLKSVGVNPGYEPVTSAATLVEVFPMGIEETTIENAVRRAALQLAWCYSKTGKTTVGDSAAIAEADVAFNIYGYDFRIILKGETVVFKFVDIYGEEQIAEIAKALMGAIPGAVSYTYPMYGEIDIETNGFTENSFAAFVASAKGLMFGTFYN